MSTRQGVEPASRVPGDWTGDRCPRCDTPRIAPTWARRKRTCETCEPAPPRPREKHPLHPDNLPPFDPTKAT